MLLRLAYLTVTKAFAALRLLPMSDREKDAEILALRHQITVLERQLGADRVKFDSGGPRLPRGAAAPLPREVAAPAAVAGPPGHRAALAS